MSATLEPLAPGASAPPGPPPPPPPGPIAQSVAIGFRAVYGAGLLLLLIWLTSNIREIASDSQAVVLRFGRIVRAQEAGLLIAWPAPIERIELLPGPERQLSQDVTALPSWSDRTQALVGPFPGAAGSSGETSAYLTGDGNVVLLAATLIYRITDPVAYALARSHVSAALDRLFRATTVHITAARNLNDFLVVQSSSDEPSDARAVIALRGEVRSSLLQTMNARLDALSGAGASLGVRIERIDMTPALPPEAKTAFDAVLLATQAADREVAVAQTDAERRRQDSDREREQLLTAAQAIAAERISRADVQTAPILALAHEESPETRPSLVLREYRARVSEIMNRVGSASLVDPASGARLVLPGTSK